MALSRIRLPLSRTELGLLVWFTVMSTWRAIGPAIKGPVDFGWDAVVYAHAARALLDGGDPWQSGVPGITYAAPPPSLLPFVPFARLPDPFVQAFWVTLAILSAIYVFRRLRMPLWWFLFPPLLLAIAAGSSALPLVALMVRGGATSDAAAAVGRIYSAVPLVLLGRFRALLLAGAALILTAPFLAWGQYIHDLPTIAALMPAQSGGGNSALAVPVLIPVAIAGLMLIGRRRAAWLAVPALWPNAQEYYAVIALPIAMEVPIATIAMATPLTPGIIAIGLFLQGVWDRVQARRATAAVSAATAPPEASAPGPASVPAAESAPASVSAQTAPAPTSVSAPTSEARQGSRLEPT